MRFVFLFLSLAGAASYAAGLEGGWRYGGLIYEGRRYPKPNSDLEVRFYFTEGGLARLTWTRRQEGEFCERIARYTLSGEWLNQTVVMVNSSNSPSCARDPDMQLGRSTVNRIASSGHELHLYFQLNGQDLIYILEPLQWNSWD